MTDKVIKYKSKEKEVRKETDLLETTEIDGISCSWTGHTESDNGFYGVSIFNFTWNFDWTKLKNEGVDRLTGHLIVTPTSKFVDDIQLEKIAIDWREGKETIFKFLPSEYCRTNAVYEYHLTAHYGQKYTQMKKISYDKMFAASEMNDTVLVVEGKKLYVNKVFLSYHSEFFRVLFSSNFKEGQLTEAPLKYVSYEDFGLLMSTINPKQVFPNDTTVPKLLELADRFLMPCVMNLVEYHLLHHSQIPNEKMMWMADAYGMPTLLEKTIRLMDTKEKAKTMQKSEEYQKLSSDTKAKLFERLLQID